MPTRLAAGFLRCLLLILLIAASGCASGPVKNTQPNPQDPFEGFNRAMYKFNDTVDTYALRPVAKGYQSVTPRPVRSGVSNFFANLSMPLTIVNDVLQLKLGSAAKDTGRFLVNTVVGLGGFLDPASHIGLESHDEDFGQTLGYWGVPNGPYLVLPFLGPSTVRDAAGTYGNWQMDPVYHYDETPQRYEIEGLRIINTRAKLLGVDEQMKNAYDPYAFMRDSYLQHRKYKVYDGNPPVEYPDYDEMYNDSGDSGSSKSATDATKSPPDSGDAPADDKNAPAADKHDTTAAPADQPPR